MMKIGAIGLWMAAGVAAITVLVGLVRAVTIEVDDTGGVTVHDPQGRVEIMRDSEPQQGMGAPSNSATEDRDALVFREAADGAIHVDTPLAAAWPADADVLVLAWSEAQRAMVPGFAERFTAPPIRLTAERLAALPPGPVELQVLWRVTGKTQSKATHLLAVRTGDAPLEVEPAVAGGPALAPWPEAGFTVWPLHPEARRIYVAQAGDDFNDGRSVDLPVRTLQRGLRLLRTGFGDQLLLRAGDTFEGGVGTWRWSGRDAQHPVLLGAFGDGDRPRIVTQGEGFLSTSMNARLRFVAFQGLHIQPARRLPAHPAFDPNDIPYREHGLWWMARGEHLTFEDCKIEGFQNNLVFQHSTPGQIRNVTVRRCIVTDSYGHWDGRIGGHSVGLFAMGVDGLLVEDSVFDHNGWAPKVAGIPGTKRTKFNHNLYLEQSSRNLNVRNNVIARGSSYGLQMRPGGEAIGNLLARNALGLYFAWHPSRVVGNVVAESVDQGDGPDDRRGYGIEAWPCEDGLIAHNLLLNKKGSADWAGAIEVTDFGSWQADVKASSLIIRDNTIVGWPVKWEDDAIVVRNPKTEVRASNNVLDVASGGDVEPRFVSPGMTLDQAAGGSFETWLERARSRPRGTWPAELTAAAINAELFEAYRVIEE